MADADARDTARTLATWRISKGQSFAIVRKETARVLRRQAAQHVEHSSSRLLRRQQHGRRALQGAKPIPLDPPERTPQDTGGLFSHDGERLPF